MSCFEDGVSRLEVNVGSRCDANASHLCCQGIGDIVPVEVGGGDDVVFGGSSENLLEKGIGDGVLDENLICWWMTATAVARRLQP